MTAQRVALDEMQSALSGKRDAIERVAAAAGRLEAAEVVHEEAAEALDQAQVCGCKTAAGGGALLIEAVRKAGRAGVARAIFLA